jgi:hypothetical protein
MAYWPRHFAVTLKSFISVWHNGEDHLLLWLKKCWRLLFLGCDTMYVYGLYINGYQGALSPVVKRPGVKLPTHLQLVPRSRTCGHIHSLPHASSWRSVYVVKHRHKYIYIYIYTMWHCQQPDHIASSGTMTDEQWICLKMWGGAIMSWLSFHCMKKTYLTNIIIQLTCTGLVFRKVGTWKTSEQNYLLLTYLQIRNASTEIWSLCKQISLL